MAAHEQLNEVHLSLALDTINLVREEIKNGSEEPIEFKLTDYRKKKEQSYISPNGYRMTIRVETNGYGVGEGTHNDISVYGKFAKARHDAELNWPFIGKITFTLMNLEDKNHHQMIATVTVVEDIQVGAGWGKLHWTMMQPTARST